MCCIAFVLTLDFKVLLRRLRVLVCKYLPKVDSPSLGGRNSDYEKGQMRYQLLLLNNIGPVCTVSLPSTAGFAEV